MYPEDFSGYTLENLLQLLDHLNATGGISNGALSQKQKTNLLARLATVRANLQQTVEYLDENIDILSYSNTSGNWY
jgi:hypothetical protein